MRSPISCVLLPLRKQWYSHSILRRCSASIAASERSESESWGWGIDSSELELELDCGDVGVGKKETRVPGWASKTPRRGEEGRGWRGGDGESGLLRGRVSK